MALAVVAAGVVPVFGQMWGGRGPGGSSEGFRGRGMPGGGEGGPGGPMGGFRGRGMPGGGERGPGGPMGGSRSRGGAPSRGNSGSPGGGDGMERLASFLRGMDADKDGRIEENEVDGRRRPFVEMMARRAGIEPKFPMSISNLEKGMAKQRAQPEGGSNSGDSSNKKKDSVDPLVPGFGFELELARVLSFGERPEDDSSGKAKKTPERSRDSRRSSRDSSPRDAPSRGSSSGGEPDERLVRAAGAMMRQADRNRNGRLEKDEWNDRWGDFGAADRNRDGVVRADELALRLGQFSRGGFGGGRRPDSNNSPGSSGSGSGSGGTDGPKSYRLRTPTERLPEGLPDWFARKDINADGQVAMAEYESPGNWTAASVAQFAWYDLNNDGMITPAECLERPEASSEIAKADVSGQVARATGPPGGGRPKPAEAPSEPRASSATGSAGGGAWDGF